jgi:IS30 family transposase
MARGRRKHSRKGTRFSLKDWRGVDELILQDFSPEQVSGFFRRREELSISHETIYTYVWRDKQAGG